MLIHFGGLTEHVFLICDVQELTLTALISHVSLIAILVSIFVFVLKGQYEHLIIANQFRNFRVPPICRISIYAINIG